ncbi:hypothetical protein INS49_003197 [Diaporthe citri]|uniref:uncharacterized protein n=1 Tax=Diaporthe citri TaxID=83186 RepID=UPI001C803BDA|nr:uncharacterized protein INS49_003197 [Diaporthe citri]KAG6368978.1 hypothetical protein INS49_003197 [Diaporthe citri]
MDCCGVGDGGPTVPSPTRAWVQRAFSNGVASSESYIAPFRASLTDPFLGMFVEIATLIDTGDEAIEL